MALTSKLSSDSRHVAEDTRLLDNFKRAYAQFDCELVESLGRYYHDDIDFIDPVHAVHGIAELKRYFASVNEGLIECRFEFSRQLVQAARWSLGWQMLFRHKSLNSGKLVCVDGMSDIELLDGRIIYHRDYYDMGAMLYEHIPVLGKCTRFLKNRLAASQPNSNKP